MNHFTLTDWILPVFVIFIILCGLLKRIPLFSAFTEGALFSLKTMAGILPSLVGLMVAITAFRASGAMDFFLELLSPFFSFFHIPKPLIPFALLRPISGSASLALITDLFKTYPPDSLIGKMASVVMGSTETTFYTIAVYFGAVGVKKLRHTLICALVADFTAIIIGCAVSYLFFA